MPTILLLSDDLMDSSRVPGPARAVGATVRTARDSSRLMQLAKENEPDLVVIDLANPGLDVVNLVASCQALARRPRIVAYGSHVDTARLQNARDAGCDVVLPRSAFVERLETHLSEWLQPI